MVGNNSTKQRECQEFAEQILIAKGQYRQALEWVLPGSELFSPPIEMEQQPDAFRTWDTDGTGASGYPGILGQACSDSHTIKPYPKELLGIAQVDEEIRVIGEQRSLAHSTR